MKQTYFYCDAQYSNIHSQLSVSSIVARILHWTFNTEKYCTTNGTHWAHSTIAILIDAFELSLNVGCHWGKCNHISLSSWWPFLRVRSNHLTLLPQHTSFLHTALWCMLAIILRSILATVISFFLRCMMFFFIDASYTPRTRCCTLWNNGPSNWPSILDSS